MGNLTKLKIFISYTENEIEIAKNIKDNLKNYNFESYIAYTDITKSKKWRSSILSNLRQCDIFLPIVSTNFEKSVWTNQEYGFAMALDKLIFPAILDYSAPGFLSEIQPFKLKYNNNNTLNLSNLFLDLGTAILENDDLEERFKLLLIDTLLDLQHEINIEHLLNLISKCKSYNEDECNKILSLILSNQNILKNQNTRILAKNFFILNENKFRRDLVGEFSNHIKIYENNIKSNKNYLTVSYHEWTGNDDDVIQIELKNVKTFAKFLDLIYFSQPGNLFEPFTDGYLWELKERSLNIPFTPVRKILGEKTGFRIEDKRTITDVGLKNGMIIDVIPIKKRKKI
jgi:hypothetical protein